MIKQIAHVCIHAADLAATERFYCGALGMRKHFEFRRGSDTVGFYLSAGNGTYVEVFRRDAAPPTGVALVHLCLEVDSVEATRARAAAHGVIATEPKLGADHSWQCWLTDPNGVRIELHQYTAESCQRTRSDCVLGA